MNRLEIKALIKQYIEDGIDHINIEIKSGVINIRNVDIVTFSENTIYVMDNEEYFKCSINYSDITGIII